MRLLEAKSKIYCCIENEHRTGERSIAATVMFLRRNTQQIKMSVNDFWVQTSALNLPQIHLLKQEVVESEHMILRDRDFNFFAFSREQADC